MKRAGNWRIGLRMAVLQQLSGLGRDASVIPRDQVYPVADLVMPERRVLLDVGVNSLYFRSNVGFDRSGGERRDGDYGTLGVTNAPMASPYNVNGGTLFVNGARDERELLQRVDHLARPEAGGDDKQWSTDDSVDFSRVALGRETKSLEMMVEPGLVIQEEEEERVNFTDFRTSVRRLAVSEALPVSGNSSLGRGFTRRPAGGLVAYDVAYTVCKPVYETARNSGIPLDGAFRHAAAGAERQDAGGEIRMAGRSPGDRERIAADRAVPFCRRRAVDRPADRRFRRRDSAILTRKSQETVLASAKSWLVRADVRRPADDRPVVRRQRTGRLQPRLSNSAACARRSSGTSTRRRPVWTVSCWARSKTVIAATRRRSNIRPTSRSC